MALHAGESISFFFVCALAIQLQCLSIHLSIHPSVQSPSVHNMIFNERAMKKGLVSVNKMSLSASLIMPQPRLKLYILLCGYAWPRKKIWALKLDCFLHNGKLSLHIPYQELFIFLGEEQPNECLYTQTAWNPVWKHRHARGWLCWPKRWPKVTSTDPLFYQAPIVNWNWREISVAWQKKKRRRRSENSLRWE